MKYIRYIAAIIALGFLASRAEASLGPVVVNLTAVQQSLTLFETTTSRTNITATTTNVATVARATTTNIVINNAKILKMLANSFNTNFPATAALKINDHGDFVVTVGTNVILNANTVVEVTFTSSVALVAGTATENERTTATATNTVSNSAETTTGVDKFTYDDSALTPADGKTTNFKIEGLRTLRSTQALSQINGVVTGTTTYIVTITGAGVGTISDKEAIIKGAVTGRVSVNGGL